MTVIAHVAIAPFGATERAVAAETEPVVVFPWVEFKGRLWFAAEHPKRGRELWKSDGTPAGTKLVKDINADGSSDPGESSDEQFAVVRDRLFFTARDGAHGGELWVTDGTTKGTRMVEDLTPNGSSAIRELEAARGWLFFTRYADGVTRLWRSDGTARGTRKVRSEGSLPKGPRNLYTWHSTVFFAASGRGAGEELWKSDGTAAGTKLVKNIRKGEPRSSYPDSFAGGKTRLYFVANDGKHFVSIYRTNGTARGTRYISNIDPFRDNWDDPPMPHSLTMIGNRLYFADNDCTHGWELWTSDGTTKGTHVIDIRPRTFGRDCGESSSPNEFVVFRGKLYFSAYWRVEGSELPRQSLWVSRGTRATTKKVSDLPKAKWRSGLDKTVVGDRFFFVASGPRTHPNKRYLWKSDGSSAGTRQVDPEADRAFHLTPVGNRVFFTGEPACVDESQEGRTACFLWKSNGTAAGTHRVFR